MSTVDDEISDHRLVRKWPLDLFVRFRVCLLNRVKRIWDCIWVRRRPTIPLNTDWMDSWLGGGGCIQMNPNKSDSDRVPMEHGVRCVQMNAVIFRNADSYLCRLRFFVLFMLDYLRYTGERSNIWCMWLRQLEVNVKGILLAFYCYLFEKSANPTRRHSGPCCEFIVMFVQGVQYARFTSVTGQRSGRVNICRWQRSRYEEYSPIQIQRCKLLGFTLRASRNMMCCSVERILQIKSKQNAISCKTEPLITFAFAISLEFEFNLPAFFSSFAMLETQKFKLSKLAIRKPEK